MQQGDYIDGGSGDDCIIVEGAVSGVTVEGGSGNDRTIVVPADTSEATIQNIFAHCYDPAWLAAHRPTDSAAALPQPAAESRAMTTPPAPPPAPKARLNVDLDMDVVAILCATLIGITFLTSRVLR